MLRSSRLPYQATTQPQPQPQLHVRNPWVDQPESLTNSSCTSRGGRIIRSSGPPPASEWLLPRHPAAAHHGPLLNQQVHPVIVSNRGSGSAAVSTVHGSSAAVSVAGGIDSCGGQCVACETFCYYCLQVVFIVGILTGISLIIAGSVRGNHRGGDLMVLVYIGVLLALVCITLLSVHCCVRRKVKERKRALRLARIQGPRHVAQPSNQFTSIPMQEFGPEYSPTETGLGPNAEFGFVDDQRPVVNIIPNPSYHTHIRPMGSNRSSISRSFSHDRRYYMTDIPDRSLHDWERQPYQPIVHRPNR